MLALRDVGVVCIVCLACTTAQSRDRRSVVHIDLCVRMPSGWKGCRRCVVGGSVVVVVVVVVVVAAVVVVNGGKEEEGRLREYLAPLDVHKRARKQSITRTL